MRAWSVVALFISGASGETSRCVTDPEAPNAYCDDAVLSDSASLLQVKAMEHVQGEPEVVAAMHTATSTRRCGEGAYRSSTQCKFSDWSDWTACSEAAPGDSGCAGRSRTRAEICEESCPGPVNPFEETTTPPPTFKVCGQVQDVTEQSLKIAGATVETAGEEPQTTDGNGQFCVTLPAGAAKFTVKAEGYVTETGVPREVVEGGKIKAIEMSHPLGKDQWRIVLSWKDKPKDLDSWTMFGKGSAEQQEYFKRKSRSNGECAMNWIWKQYNPDSTGVKCSTSGVTAYMDQDNTDITRYDWAETTTLSGVDGTTCDDDCKIHFCVYQYEPKKSSSDGPYNGENRESGATVDVYNGDVHGKSGKVGTFEIGKQGNIVDVPEGVSGTSMWFVFSIDATTSKVIECTDVNSECAKISCGQGHAR